MRITSTVSDRPASSLKAADWSDYDSVAARVRYLLGVDRLSPARAAEVRAAVARHTARQGRQGCQTATYAPITRLRELLRSETASSVRLHMRGFYRVYELRPEIQISPTPQVRRVTTMKWVSGRPGFGRVSYGETIELNVMPAWQTHVLHRRLAELDGLVTTHATLVQEVGGIEVYRAAWVRQGRGYELTVQTGLIAYHRASGTSYHHSGTCEPKRALAGLRRKLNAQAIPVAERAARYAEQQRRRQERQAAQLGRLVERLQRWDLTDIAHVRVSRADSLRAGNCEPGTDEFIDRFFPDRTHSSSATIAEIAGRVGHLRAEHLSEATVTLARQLAAACLVAIRRDRQATHNLTV